MKRWLLPTLKIALAASLIVYLLRSGKVPLAPLAALKTRWPWFVAGEAVFGVVLFLAACRWKILLAAQGLNYRLRDVVGLNLIGLFFNQFMLGSTGGDVAKAVYVARDNPDRKTASVLAVFIDRILGLVVLVWIAGLAVLLNIEFANGFGDGAIVWKDHFVADQVPLAIGAEMGGVVLTALAITVWTGMVLIVVGGYLVYGKGVRSSGLVKAALSRLPFQDFLKKLSAAVYVYKFHLRRVLLASGLTVVLHLCVVATNVFVFLALRPELPPITALLMLVPIAQIVLAIPITPGGLGTGEAAYNDLFLLLAGVPEGIGFNVCVLLRLIVYSWAAVGYVVFYCGRRRTRTDDGPGDPKSGELEEPPSGPAATAKQVPR